MIYLAFQNIINRMNKIPTTVEAQIRTRARNLPIYKCYVNENWQKVQKATILIIRKHTNGNITLGNFLVDLKLRGIKDCVYMFNESPLRIDEIRKQYPMHQECDYNLVHNIIYAGLEFAEDYGFEPHKNFKTAQYILEEDTDDIPLIEIPLGENGIPVLEIPYGENCQREIAILQKTAGADYRMVYLDKDGKPQPQERSYMDVMNEILETGVDSFVEKTGDSTTDLESQVITDLIYVNKVFTENDISLIDDEFNLIAKDPRLSQSHIQLENTHEEEFEQAYKYFNDGKIDEAYDETLKLIDRHPEDPFLWDILLYNLSVVSDSVHEEAVKEAYSRFPEDPTIKAWYAEWLAQEERFDDVFALFNQLPGLDALTTEKIPISAHALESFCYAYSAAWLNKKDVLRTEPYYQISVRLDYNYRIGGYIRETVKELKRNKLTEIYVPEMLESDNKSDNE